MTEDDDKKENTDEVELFESQKCKVKVKKDGSLVVKCDTEGGEVQINANEVKMVDGISDLAPDNPLIHPKVIKPEAEDKEKEESG